MMRALSSHGKLSYLSLADDILTGTRECHQNRTLFEALQLERHLNVASFGELARKMNIEDEVGRLTADLRLDTQLVLLTGQAKAQLRSFASSELLNVNFTSYSILVIILSPSIIPFGWHFI